MSNSNVKLMCIIMYTIYAKILGKNSMYMHISFKSKFICYITIVYFAIYYPERLQF